MPKVQRDMIGYLTDLIKKSSLKDAGEKLENKIQKEVKLAQGIDTKTSMQQGLDHLGKMDEFTQMNE